LEGIREKYEHNEDEDYGGFIVFMSSSPDVKKGMFPRIMSLCDYSLEHVGNNGLVPLSRLSHITELDLSENSFSKWSEMLRILDIFPNLTFLNMCKNNFAERLEMSEAEQSQRRPATNLKKLVLNHNQVDWASLSALTQAMPQLEELHLSNNGLKNPQGEFGHPALKSLFLTCNDIDSFSAVQRHLGSNCPNLQCLSLSECPLADVPAVRDSSDGLSSLVALNVNQTKIAKWSDVDNFRSFPSLQELRIRGCPLMEEYTAHERRSLLVARLPNVSIFNGGDKVPANEREDAERAFIRFYMDLPSQDRPARYQELVAVHGQLDPLVDVSMKPATHVKVTISARDGEVVREEVVSVYQTVAQFKACLHEWFSIPVQNMRLWYCDQVLLRASGPEEMKWPQKGLYTYNVREGDSFILDEKAPPLPKLKTAAPGSAAYSTSPKVYGDSPIFPTAYLNQNSRNAVTFAVINKQVMMGQQQQQGSKPGGGLPSGAPTTQPRSQKPGVARNLFPSSSSGVSAPTGTQDQGTSSSSPAPAPSEAEANNNDVKEKNSNAQ